jgi:hypothetical protein
VIWSKCTLANSARLVFLSLFGYRRSILKQLQPGDDDMVSGIDALKNRIVIPDDIPQFQKPLSRRRSFVLLHCNKREELSIDPLHRKDRHDLPLTSAQVICVRTC